MGKQQKPENPSCCGRGFENMPLIELGGKWWPTDRQEVGREEREVAGAAEAEEGTGSS